MCAVLCCVVGAVVKCVALCTGLDNIVRNVNVSTCVRDSVAHAWIRCDAPAGVGIGHRWTVSVGGQSSSPSTATTSYMQPSLLLLSGVGSANANTDGGQTVNLNGYNFGPVSSTVLSVNDRLIRVTYGPSVRCVVAWLPRWLPSRCIATVCC